MIIDGNHLMNKINQVCSFQLLYIMINSLNKRERKKEMKKKINTYNQINIEKQ